LINKAKHLEAGSLLQALGVFSIFETWLSCQVYQIGEGVREGWESI
jgi:hypothetical protein